jgi:hypothetical protein
MQCMISAAQMCQAFSEYKAYGMAGHCKCTFTTRQEAFEHAIEVGKAIIDAMIEEEGAHAPA